MFNEQWEKIFKMKVINIMCYEFSFMQLWYKDGGGKGENCESAVDTKKGNMA